jgi:hypothetical protein
MSHDMNVPKQIQFEYNLDNKVRDLVMDHHGNFPCYEVGDILMRRDKSWKVTRVLLKESDSDPLPTLYISLSDKF